jgi:site-specific DNA-cytosine methylase
MYKGGSMNDIKCNCIGLLSGGKWDRLLDHNRRVYSVDGLSPTITTCGGGGNQEVKILEPQVMTPKRTEHGKAVRKAYENGEHKESRHTMTKLEPREDGITNTLTTVQKDNLVIEPSGIYLGTSPAFQRGPLQGVSRTLKATTHDAGVVLQSRIRKLTPLECWRLMGFDDTDHEKAVQAGVSNSQRYKQAGNSIVVNVLEAIFKEMF